MTEKSKVYLAGNIMGFGDNLARQYEYDKLMSANLDLDVYSPVMNKSINDKVNMTEEENNHLAEKIVAADAQRLWEADTVVIEPRQDAIGTLCEVGILYGWWYMERKLNQICQDAFDQGKSCQEMAMDLLDELKRIGEKANYFHYFDIRTNHLNEKDWRRSFSINQFLYGVVLACSKDNKLYNSFDEVLPELKKLYSSDADLEEKIELIKEVFS